MGDTGLIGGPFTLGANPSFLGERMAIFERLFKEYQEQIAAKGDIPIKVTLPNGDVKEGLAFKTTAYDIAKGISQGLADNVVIAKVVYTSRYEEDKIVACDDDDEAAEAAAAQKGGDEGELWDLNRPLIGDCQLKLLKFDEPEAKTVRILLLKCHRCVHCT